MKGRQKEIMVVGGVKRGDCGRGLYKTVAMVGVGDAVVGRVEGRTCGVRMGKEGQQQVVDAKVAKGRKNEEMKRYSSLVNSHTMFCNFIFSFHLYCHFENISIDLQ
ncbi:hypothetical protein LOK49_LG11G00686 [Camellia lanceoleosa]|uniref:Uncharacterized protein n=1 Tax=Camellia lanceoleosa TaxID=1840588 RepID=A0ACC0G3T4_9ERIC|nr:hypothetical protein LOK49_LG11G00686 [Camellia lanceoleosa]